MVDSAVRISNNDVVALADVPLWQLPRFIAAIDVELAGGARVVSYFAHHGGTAKVELWCVLARDDRGELMVLRSHSDAEFPSLAARHPQIQLFEREIYEQFSLVPVGHPWLKPVRFEPSWRDHAASAAVIGDFTPYQVAGEEIHEVAVGPVHAGVIEPGHFRFQCHGEEVKHLEISLGFQHRGVEHLLVGGPTAATLLQMEALAGDTTIGHTSAYCQLCESLGGVKITPAAARLRAIALELERLANHVGDVGALSGDTGFLTTASYCGSIRGNILNLSADICGNRFGRGLLRPGGVNFAVDEALAQDLLKKLDAIEDETNGAIALFYDSPSVLARMDGVGCVSMAVAAELGLVGPAARASGLVRDVRQHYPGVADDDFTAAEVENAGDVQARALVRRREIAASFALVRQRLQQLPPGEVALPVASLLPEHIGVALVEGWRGEIVHVAITDDAGRFARYKVVDPSFHNWSGLAMALRGQQISDFPLCNKSFNLSYCGFDL